MVEPQEVCLGNWLLSRKSGNYIEVTGLKEEGVTCSEGLLGWEDLDGIKITESIAIVIGFKRNSFGNFDYMTQPHGKSLVLTSIDPNQFLFLKCTTDQRNPDVVGIHNYDWHGYLKLHRFQNILTFLSWPSIIFKIVNNVFIRM